MIVTMIIATLVAFAVIGWSAVLLRPVFLYLDIKRNWDRHESKWVKDGIQRHAARFYVPAARPGEWYVFLVTENGVPYETIFKIKTDVINLVHRFDFGYWNSDNVTLGTGTEPVRAQIYYSMPAWMQRRIQKLLSEEFVLLKLAN